MEVGELWSCDGRAHKEKLRLVVKRAWVGWLMVEDSGRAMWEEIGGADASAEGWYPA